MSYSPLTYPFHPSVYLPRDDLFISIFRCRKEYFKHKIKYKYKPKIFVERTF